jgi:hypothetical protein
MENNKIKKILIGSNPPSLFGRAVASTFEVLSRSTFT